MLEILHALPPKTFRHNEKCSHVCMEDAVYALPQDLYNLLAGASTAKKRRLDAAASVPVHVQLSIPRDNPVSFFETVSDNCCWNCITKFIDSTCHGSAGTPLGTHDGREALGLQDARTAIRTRSEIM
jgi:hypothetical protein